MRSRSRSRLRVRTESKLLAGFCGTPRVLEVGNRVRGQGGSHGEFTDAETQQYFLVNIILLIGRDSAP